MYLCERCGVDPGSLGWRGETERAACQHHPSFARRKSWTTAPLPRIVAQVFARRFEDRLRYCHHTGAWFEWTGNCWKRDETALAFQFCRELAREFAETPASAS